MIYIAGNSVDAKTDIDITIRNSVSRLLSYYHITNDGFGSALWGKLVKMKNKEIDLFLDSGAFSAWSQDVEIKIGDYIAFIKKHKKGIDVYANLDDIRDPEATWKNQIRMEKAGLHPLPCFHYGEDPKWLKKYLAKGHSYIALGGMVPISTKNLILWLDTIFPKYLCDQAGMPKVKIHGFGLTSLRLMLRYPWYSVDSTSWVITGRLGSVYVPRYRQGRWTYNESSWKVVVSNRSPSQKEKGKHISTFSPKEQEIILVYLKSKGFELGKSIFRTMPAKYKLKDGERWFGKPIDGQREVETIVESGLCNDYKQRDEANIMYFIDLEKAIPKWPWAFKIKSSIGLGV